MITKSKCYYDILNVSNDASMIDIKKSYYKLALKYHPDKQKETTDEKEAVLKFQQIQHAYDILSDLQERKWYDDHREEILFTNENNKNELSKEYDGIHLWKYFRSDIFTSYDIQINNNYYSVYSDLFNKIIELEENNRYKYMNYFENIDIEMNKLNLFYQYWLCFSTNRTFSWHDEYTNDKENSRFIRRKVDKENKKKRDEAKKKYNIQIRQLTEYIRKKDPRIKKYLEEIELDKIKKNQTRKIHLEKIASMKENSKYNEYDDDLNDEKDQNDVEMYDESNEIFNVEETNEDEKLFMESYLKKKNVVIIECQYCNKRFKSENQYTNHCNSKKHKDHLKQINKLSEKLSKLNIPLDKNTCN